MTAAPYRRVIMVYLVSSGLFALAASLIWAVNTLFLLGPGKLTIFQVFLTNAVFVIGSAVFEVPTGVVADTIGRKASYVIGLATLIVSTLLYMLSATFGWGFIGFSVAGVLIGLGFTFQTGAVDAWLVDALDATGWEQPKDRVFAWGAQVFGAATLVGSLLGGVLGQANLQLPYLVRAISLGGALLFVVVYMKEIGFEPRPLRASEFGTETKRIFDAGVEFGWHNPVIRPLLWASATSSLFMMFAFYGWQRYVLDLLGSELVWIVGVIQAAFSLTAIAGNMLVPWIAGTGARRRDPAHILMWGMVAVALLAAALGGLGLLGLQPGWPLFSAGVVLWLGFGLAFGVTGPVGQAFTNEHIPSAQRATVLSLQAFFGDAGAGVGQPILGWLAQRTSLALAYLVGSTALAATAPLYAQAGRAARELVRRDTRDSSS